MLIANISDLIDFFSSDNFLNLSACIACLSSVFNCFSTSLITSFSLSRFSLVCLILFSVSFFLSLYFDIPATSSKYILNSSGLDSISLDAVP